MPRTSVPSRCWAKPREYVMFEDTGDPRPIDRGSRFDCDWNVTEQAGPPRGHLTKRKSECCIAGDPSGRASPDERARRLRYNDLKEVAPVWQGNCSYGVCIRLVLPNGVLALRGSRSVTSSLLPG